MVTAPQFPLMPVSQLRINADRLLADFEALAKIGAQPNGAVSRPALSLEDLEARAWFADQIEEAHLRYRDDDAGNLSGVLPSADATAKSLLIGSHLDGVVNGGHYDGTIGVLAGLEVLRTVREAGLSLPVHLEVVNFTDEEGTWFSLLGSRGMTGRLPVAKLGDKRGQDGAFRAALTRAGIDIARLKNARRDPAGLLGFLELHIEQGNVLNQLGADIGIVRGVVGRTTYQLTFHGERGHSGTTDFYSRKDALQGAAMFITRAHILAHDRHDGSLVNCGKLDVHPGTFNVIPERAQLLVECRHAQEETLLELEGDLLALAQDCAEMYQLRLEAQRLEHMDAGVMDAGVSETIEQACDQLNLLHKGVVSYAGHDAQPMSAFTPTGLIFIPSVGGMSHSPMEFSHWADVVNGANVLLHTTLALATQGR